MLHAARVLRGALVLLALIAAALAAAMPAQAQPLIIGIADQRAGTFHDQRVTTLVRNARLSVAWDAMQYDWQRREIDAWMRAAETANITPLVTFGRSRTRKFSLPPTDVYRSAVLSFRRRYP
jgi:hypothetical protein